MSKQTEALKLALEALAASDDFLFNYHDCEPNNEREVDAYSEVRANNMAAWEAIREALAEQPAQHVLEVRVWRDKNHDQHAEFRGYDKLPDGEHVFYTSQQPARQHQCSRSHPHENMDAMCELRTEIARLTNENARLKAQQQEPVAWIEHGSNEVPSIVVWERGGSGHYTPLYTSPQPSKPWRGLTDEELADIAMQSGAYDGQLRDFARAIEAKLREKNT